MNTANLNTAIGGPLHNWREVLLSSTVAAQALDRLQAKARDFGVEALASCRAEIALYRSIEDGNVLERITEHCMQHASLMGALRHRDFVFDDGDFEFIRENASLRAREGVPLEVLLHAYRVGNRVMWGVLWQFMVDLAAPVAPDTALSTALATYTMDYTNRISTEVARAYGDMQRRAEALAVQQRRTLLERLLTGTADATTYAALEPFGLDENTSYVVASAKLTAPSNDPESAISFLEAPNKLRQTCQSGRQPALADLWDQRIVAVLPMAKDQDHQLAAKLLKERPWLQQVGMTIGLSSIQSGIASIPRAEQDAQHANAHTASMQPVMRFDDIPLFEHLIATAEESLHRIRPQWAEALLEDDNRLQGVLLETLQAFFRSRMSASTTADILGVHVNTVYHRLKKIEEITSKRTGSVADLLDLIVALRLRGSAF